MGRINALVQRFRSETLLRLGLILGLELILAAMADRIFDRLVWPFAILTVAMFLLVTMFARVPGWVLGVSIVAAGALAGLATGWWAGAPLNNVVPAEGIRQLVTTEWPSPFTPNAVAAVALTLALIDGIATALTLRDDIHVLPLLPVALGAVAATALSAPAGPQWWVWIVGSTLALVFIAVRPGTSLATRASALASERSLVASVALLAIAGVVGLTATPDNTRTDPRQLDEPELTAPLLDPIEATIAMRNSSPPVALFDLENRSTTVGPTMPAYWRMTVLNSYDGQRWQPDAALRPIGNRLSTLPNDQRLTRAPFSYTISPRTDQLDVVPFPGKPLSVSANVSTDERRSVVRLRDRPKPGAVFNATSLIQPNRQAVGNNLVATRPVDEIAATFTDVATELAGKGTGITQLDSIEAAMREEWALDPTAPGAGQQLALLDRFARGTRRGSAEQFASTFVLLARSLGFDSRVATGFAIPPEQTAAKATLDTKQAAVWPEVRIEDLGWIRFNPIPTQVAEQQNEQDQDKQLQSPSAPPPPVAPPAEPADRADETDETPSQGPGRFDSLRRIALEVLTYSSVIVLPIALVIGAIIGAKAWRRRRRLNATDPTQRVRAAWANTTDNFVDAGLVIPRSWTDLHIASSAVPLAPTTPGEIDRLAKLSTRVTFADADSIGDVDDAAERAVTMSDSVRTAIVDNMTRFQRIRWRLSLRSLRRRTRSPVTP